ncbi:MAG: hypothetical protein ACHQT8_04970 [Chlamydiales bacterium]
MSLIIGDKLPGYGSLASHAVQETQKAVRCWSKADYFKWMVYSVISGLGFKWATTKLSELNSFYGPTDRSLCCRS